VTLLAPLAGLFALIIPAIVALYFLRVRRPEVPLSSTLLWRRALRDRQASVPWQRLRFSWLLLLQLLAAALLVFALMRPAVTTHAALATDTIVVIDDSMSMQATDVSPSRFEVARQKARAIFDQMTAGTRVSLVAMDDHPRLLASRTGDPGPLRDALDRLHPSNGGADLHGALAVAASTAGASEGARLVLLSDGITEGLRAPLTLPFAVDYQRIGVTAENMAVTALTIVTQPGQRDAVAHVENLGRERASSSLELRVDGRIVDLRHLDLEPHAGTDVLVPLPARAGEVTATLTPHDALAVDDSATVAAQPGRTYHVELVTAHDVFLDRALRLRPDIALATVTPDHYRPDAAVDMWVFDGFLPKTLPDQPYWVVAPPSSVALGAGEVVAGGHPRAAVAADPVVSGVDLSTVHVARTRDLRSSTFGRAVIESEAGPLLLLRDSAPRAALLGFDVHDSDLPLRNAFPLLVDRVSRFLLPEDLPAREQGPGDLVQITPENGVTDVTVTRPDGTAVALGAEPGRTLTYGDTGEVGLYTVNEKRSGGQTALVSHFAVNAFDPLRSSIAPHSRLDLSGAATAATVPAPASQQDIWPWLAALLLAVLTIEWLVSHRAR
jgi:Ca-activated chloride channel homolog